jgi:glucokinase
VLDGCIVRHTHGGAGHVGQLIVDSAVGAPRGRCGTAGCLEARAAGPALERAAEEAGLAPSLAELQLMCQSGDTRAVAVVDAAARFLGIALVNVVHLYAPDEVVIGGGAAGALPVLIERAGAHLRDLGGDLVPDDLVVRPAALGDDAGMIGAALLALRCAENGAAVR